MGRRREWDTEGVEGGEWGVGIPPQPTRGLGYRRKLPSRISGGNPAAYAFLSFTHLTFLMKRKSYARIWSSILLQILGVGISGFFFYSTPLNRTDPNGGDYPVVVIVQLSMLFYRHAVLLLH